MLGHCRNNNLEQAKKIFSVIPKKGCERNVVTYNVLIHGLCDAGELDESFSLFSQMVEEGWQPNVRTYTILIAALCGSLRMDEPFNLLKEMVKKGVKPNVHTYTVLIDSLCRGNKLGEASKLLNEIAENGLRPGVVTYNALIYGYCQEARPTIVTCTILIDAQLCKEGKLKHALAVFGLLFSTGCRPDVQVYTVFVCAYLREGKVVEAEEIMLKMRNEGASPDVVTYNTLIDGYGKLGLMDHAFASLKSTREAGCMSDCLTYEFLVKHFFYKLQIGVPLEKLDTSSSLDSIESDNLWKTIKYEHVMTLLEEMLQHGCSPDIHTYDVLIAGFCNGGILEEAEELVSYMEGKCVEAQRRSGYSTSCIQLLTAGRPLPSNHLQLYRRAPYILLV